MQATKLFAVTLAIVLSPRLATADVVQPMSQPSVESVASESRTEKAAAPADETGAPTPATVASDSADQRDSDADGARVSAPRSKKRWGSLRRLPLLRRPAAPAVGCLEDEDEDGDAQLLSTSSFSNCSAVSGLAKR